MSKLFFILEDNNHIDVQEPNPILFHICSKIGIDNYMSYEYIHQIFQLHYHIDYIFDILVISIKTTTVYFHNFLYVTIKNITGNNSFDTPDIHFVNLQSILLCRCNFISDNAWDMGLFRHNKKFLSFYTSFSNFLEDFWNMYFLD